MNSCSPLPLQDILPDSLFRLSFPLRPALWGDLARRFPGFPLLLLDRKRRLVFGHDYFNHLRRTGAKTAPVLTVTGNDEEHLELALHLKRSLQGCNLYEKLAFINKFLPYAPLPAIQSRFPLGLSLNESTASEIGRLLHPRYKGLLCADRIGFRALLQLSRLSLVDQEPLLHLFGRVRFNENQQLKLLEIVQEMPKRHTTSVDSILKQIGIDRLLDREMQQKPILEALSRLRFPAFSQALDDWRKKAEEIGSRRCELTPHPYFEKQEVQLTIRCHDLEEAFAIIKKLEPGK